MVPRSVVIVTHPTVEPVSLSDAKAHLRLPADFEDDDATVTALVGTARRLIERRLGIALAATRYRATWERAEAVVRLPVSPHLSGQAYPVVVESVDSDGNATAVDSSAYRIDADSNRLIFSTLPAGELRVTSWAGIPAGTAIAPQLRSALLMFVGHLYANREASTLDGASELPMGVEMLLASESVSGVY